MAKVLGMVEPVVMSPFPEEGEADTTVAMDPLMGIAAALLAFAGLATREEGRAIAGLPPISLADEQALLSQLRWMQSTGKNFPAVWADLWRKL